MIENKIKEKHFPAKICFFFPPLVKAKNKHQNFEKLLIQKRCAIRHLNVKKKIFLTKRGKK